MSARKSSTSAKKSPKGSPVHRSDASMIISRLATIEDPMLSYLLGMVVDRVAQLVDPKRKCPPKHDIPKFSEMLANEPHGVPFVRPEESPGES